MTAIEIVKKKDMKELVISLHGVWDESQSIQTMLEMAQPDFQFWFETNLDSLLNRLRKNGLTDDEIMLFHTAPHGPVIDFYVVGEGVDKIYVMGIGQR